MRIFAFGLSHHTAEIGIREQIAVSNDRNTDVLTLLHDIFQEVVFVSTCNRTEAYGVFKGSHVEAKHSLISIFSQYSQLPFETLEEKSYFLIDHEAIKHLFRVISSLDSMVVGENQITGQIKAAYNLAKKQHTVGKILHPLFSHAFSVVKGIKTKTGISKGAVSVSSIAVDMAENILDSLDGKTAMIIGAGKTSKLTLKYLVSHGCSTILVTNRSFEHASRLAKEFSGKAIRFDSFLEEMQQVDIVISSTSAPHHIINIQQVIDVMNKRDSRPLLFIDLAVPRDIPEEIREIDGIFLYTIDDLSIVAESNLAKRRAEVLKAEALIEQHMIDLDKFFLANRLH
ncbi:glutamyl-tRNA reductase [bacterium]|nr:glutamyl-tRNA reductase [bacterium]